MQSDTYGIRIKVHSTVATRGEQQKLSFLYDSFSRCFFPGMEDFVLSPMKILLPFKSVSSTCSCGWATYIMRLTPAPALPALLQASILQGQAGQGSVSRLPFQSKSWKSKSLYSINKIPALFTVVRSQFTWRVDKGFLLAKGLKWVTVMKEDPRMLINRYCNLHKKGGPKATSIPTIRKSRAAGLNQQPEMQQHVVSATISPDQVTLFFAKPGTTHVRKILNSSTSNCMETRLRGHCPHFRYQPEAQTEIP